MHREAKVPSLSRAPRGQQTRRHHDKRAIATTQQQHFLQHLLFVCAERWIWMNDHEVASLGGWLLLAQPLEQVIGSGACGAHQATLNPSEPCVSCSCSRHNSRFRH